MADTSCNLLCLRIIASRGCGFVASARVQEAPSIVRTCSLVHNLYWEASLALNAIRGLIWTIAIATSCTRVVASAVLQLVVEKVIAATQCPAARACPIQPVWTLRYCLPTSACDAMGRPSRIVLIAAGSAGTVAHASRNPLQGRVVAAFPHGLETRASTCDWIVVLQLSLIVALQAVVPQHRPTVITARAASWMALATVNQREVGIIAPWCPWLSTPTTAISRELVDKGPVSAS
mmetsp:Transcript_47652/g.113226  ORF Transcript_47652/g.113226 Transcript_47652/m.113226 type:complete len:234 (+) Transcript_47652:290-991(+)